MRSHPAQCRLRASRGFTLIELLVVISIIVLLISILLPVLRQARISAIRVQCMSNLRQLGALLNVYADDHRGELPDNYAASLIPETAMHYLESTGHGQVQTFSCPNIADLAVLDANATDGTPFGDYWATVGYQYLGKLSTSAYVLIQPSYTVERLQDPPGWLLASDYVYGDGAGTGDTSVLTAVRTGAHIKNGYGYSYWLEGPPYSTLPAGLYQIDGSNHLYNDSHVAWQMGTELTRNLGWAGAGIYWKTPSN